MGKKHEQLLVGALVSLLVIPELVYIILNNAVWDYDPSFYGICSVRLYHELWDNPLGWAGRLFDIVDSSVEIKAAGRPPMLFWIGQFFVPLRKIVGSVDKALLLSVLFYGALSLVLFYKIIREVFKDRGIAIAGCVMLASTSLFVGLTTTYYMEALCLLCVVWFLYILAKADDWDYSTIVLQLLMATCFALLVKVTNVLYCAGPGLAILVVLSRRKADFGSMITSRKGRVAGATILLLLTLRFYFFNFNDVLFHAKFSATHTMWGQHTGFAEKLIFWLGQVEETVFPLALFGLVAAVSLVWGVLAPKSNKTSNMLFFISLFQIVLFVAVYSAGSNEFARFLLPMAPYFVVISCWSLSRIRKPAWNYAFILAAGIQLCSTQGMAYGVLAMPDSDNTIKAIVRSEEHRKQLGEIFKRTCKDGSKDKIVVVAASVAELHSVTVQYQGLKSNLPGYLRCAYKHVNIYDSNPDVVGIDAAAALENMISGGVEFFVALAPDVYAKYHGRFMDETYLELTNKVERSRHFKRERLDAYPGVRIYRRVVGERD